jgi:hypothetical protein
LRPASRGERTFKYIAALSGLVWHPDWSSEALVADLKREIDYAMDLGYQVVAGPAYILSDQEWMSEFATLKNAGVGRAMRDMINANYQLDPAFSDPLGGTYLIVRRRPAP